MLNMNSPAVAFLGISRKFLNTSDKILLLKGIIIIVSLILQTIKIWLNLLSDRWEDLINQLFVPTAKMLRHIGKQMPRGDELVINCQSFNSNSEITSFSSKKNPSTEP